MKRLVLLASVLSTLAACQVSPLGPAGVRGPTSPDAALPPASPFNPDEFAWSTQPGRDVLTGVMAYRRGETVYGCTGEDVLLIPETPWSRRRMIVLYGSTNSAAVPVSIVRARTPSASTGDYARYVRRTSCDAEGRFSFAGLPDGAWYVITVAKPLGGQGEGVALTRRVELRGGTRNITLY
jgi:hypothetical protein